MDEHCFHLQIIDNMAFVYDPFSMDGPSESLLMDWGTPGANEKVHEYVVEKCPKDRVLHTFTFPVKRVRPTQSFMINFDDLIWSCVQGSLVLHRCPCMEYQGTLPSLAYSG